MKAKFSWADILFAISIVVFTTVLCVCVNQRFRNNKPIITRDTITIYDTIVKPIAHDSIVLRYQKVKVPISKTDTLTQVFLHTDSVMVDVPITQKTYEDSTYKAVVSGFNPSLDSILIKNRYITQTIKETKYKNKHWGLGVTGGYDPINRNFGVMVGLQYNILLIK